MSEFYVLPQGSLSNACGLEAACNFGIVRIGAVGGRTKGNE